MTVDNDHYLCCLSDLSKEFDYELCDKGDRISFHNKRSPISVNFEFTDALRKTVFVYFYARSTSWELIGERTDANEFISVMLGAFLRVESGVSCSLWEIAHPLSGMAETEIYARYIVCDQPCDSQYLLDVKGLQAIRDILHCVRAFECKMPLLFDWSVTDSQQPTMASQGYGCAQIEDWARGIASVIDEPWQSKEHNGPDTITFNWRLNPNWKFYRSISSGVTVYEMPGFASALVRKLTAAPPWQIVESPTSTLYVSDQACNAVALADSELARKLLRDLSRQNHCEPIVLVPLERDVVAASLEHIVILRRECGRKQFENEREVIRLRHQRESALLFPPLAFEWKENVDDEQFELLILDLIRREPGVQRARMVGGSHDPDSGRDILCDWHTPPTAREVLFDDVPPSALRRVVIQCKAYRRAVNKSDVRDIRDTVENSEANGYFLAVSSHITSPLTDHLDRIRERGQIWVDWWTRSEIEERLTKNTDIAQKYSRVVQLKCP